MYEKMIGKGESASEAHLLQLVAHLIPADWDGHPRACELCVAFLEAEVMQVCNLEQPDRLPLWYGDRRQLLHHCTLQNALAAVSALRLSGLTLAGLLALWPTQAAAGSR